jgi:hypothetical protein
VNILGGASAFGLTAIFAFLFGLAAAAFFPRLGGISLMERLLGKRGSDVGAENDVRMRGCFRVSRRGG